MLLLDRPVSWVWWPSVPPISLALEISQTAFLETRARSTLLLFMTHFCLGGSAEMRYFKTICLRAVIEASVLQREEV